MAVYGEGADTSRPHEYTCVYMRTPPQYVRPYVHMCACVHLRSLYICTHTWLPTRTPLHLTRPLTTPPSHCPVSASTPDHPSSHTSLPPFSNLKTGAQFELTPRAKGMSGAIQRATELVAETPGACEYLIHRDSPRFTEIRIDSWTINNANLCGDPCLWACDQAAADLCRHCPAAPCLLPYPPLAPPSRPFRIPCRRHQGCPSSSSTR
jgi:hypothetical protein